MPLARGERDVLLMVTAAGTAFDTLHTHVDIDWLATDWNTTETADCVPITYDYLTSALRTAQFIVPSLHVQNNSIIFVLCSGTLDRAETESVIHKADVHNYYLF